MNFNEIFPNIYVINLPKATERWNRVSTLLTKMDVTKFNKFPACVINNGATVRDREDGCKESHIQIVKAAKIKNLPYVTIFEDDIEIRSDFVKYLPTISNFIKKFPWDLFYLGCNYRCPPIPFGIPNIVKIPQAFTTHAYVINASVYDTIIDIKNTPQNKEPKNQIDVLYSRIIQSNNKCFGITPRLFSQINGMSTIQNKLINYRALRDD